MNRLKPAAVELFHACYAAALQAVNGEQVVRRYLQNHPLSHPRVRVVAVGKAAQTMLAGALSALGEQCERGLLISARDYWTPDLPLDSRVESHFSDHPVPGPASLAAGAALLRFVAEPGDYQLLFLMSGGSSSLVEVLAPGVALSELAELNRYLLAAGLDIAQMNAARQALSMIKNGRLRSYLANPNYLALYLSDVPGDDLRVIGSGPLAGQGLDGLAALPLSSEWLQRLIACRELLLAQVADQGQHVLLASLGHALEAARDWASAQGVAVWLHTEFLQGEVEALAGRLVAALPDLPPGLHLWGAEPQVCLPPSPGRGGRNQQLVLAAAREMAGREGVWLFSAATDGRDGESDTAAAWCDGHSWQRAQVLGLAPAQALRQANAEPCLQALGATLPARATGSNVMDLVLIYKQDLKKIV